MQTVLLCAFEQHAPDSRVHRQSGQLPTQMTHRTSAINRAQLLQQGKTIADGAAIRRFNKGEIFDTA